MELTAAQLVTTLPQVEAEAPLTKALYEMRQAQLPLVAVVADGQLRGFITEETAFSAALYAEPDSLPARAALIPPPPPVESDTPVSVLSELFRKPGLAFVPVRSPDGRLQGVILRSTFLHYISGTFRPRRMGGMATPLGVHLTDGSNRGGPSDLGLVLTGAVLAGLFIATYLILLAALFLAGKFFHFPLAEIFLTSIGGYFPHEEAWLLVMELALGLLFLVLMRSTDLAGFHGAEHKTVSALEHGMPLKPEAIRPFSPVHPRCGTNFVALFALVGVLAGGFQVMVDLHPLLPVAYLVVAWLSWRKLGALVQRWLTTKEPTDAQLASAIKAAEELTVHYQLARGKRANFFMRLWNRGFPQVVAGGGLVMLLADGCLKLLDKLLPHLLGLA